MSRQIIRDVEEALSREIRRITFNENRTISRTVLQDMFDPITGEVIQAPIQPDFYDSSADASHIQYPNFTLKLLKSREDRFSGRQVPQYGKWCKASVSSSPQAFSILAGSSDGLISAPSNTISTTLFNIRKIQAGDLIRLLSGNNKGTYYISSIAIGAPHIITLDNDLLKNLPSFSFHSGTRTIVFDDPVDLNTIIIGDSFVDSSLNSFTITAINLSSNSIIIGGISSPILTTGAKVTRSGTILNNIDSSPIRFIIMDPSSPIQAVGVSGLADSYSSFTGVSPAIPIDLYYLIRIDSKERDSHIDVLNRVWEEFNPPRTGLPTVIRSSLSNEQLLTQDIPTGGSSTVYVSNNADFNLQDKVYIIDELHPTKDTSSEGFERPFESKIIDKISTDRLVLSHVVPDTFVLSKGAKIISNADFYIHMFHYVDHVTKDIDGSQYWVHEFTFMIQVWVERLGDISQTGTITDIATPIEDLQGNIIIDDI